MTRAGLSRPDIKRTHDSLLARGQHPPIDAVCVALGSTGSKTATHRYLKELEEEEGTALRWTGTTSGAILNLVGRLATRLHEEGRAVADQQTATVTAQHQQVRAEADKLSADLATLRAESAQAHATIANVRATQSDTQATLQRRTIEAERSAQQLQDPTARLTEHEDFRHPLEDKLQCAHQALEHFRNASKKQRDQDARWYEQQVQQLQAEIRQANQTLIVKQGEVTQLDKGDVRLVTETGTAAKRVRELEIHGEQAQLTLDQTCADRARMEAECDALRTVVQAQVGELTATRTEHENMVGESAKLSMLLEARQVMLTDYRAQFGVAGPAA